MKDEIYWFGFGLAVLIIGILLVRAKNSSPWYRGFVVFLRRHHVLDTVLALALSPTLSDFLEESTPRRFRLGILLIILGFIFVFLSGIFFR